MSSSFTGYEEKMLFSLFGHRVLILGSVFFSCFKIANLFITTEKKKVSVKLNGREVKLDNRFTYNQIIGRE